MIKLILISLITSTVHSVAQSVTAFDPDRYIRRSPGRANLSAPSSEHDSDMGDQIILGDYTSGARNPIRLDIYQQHYWSDTRRVYGPVIDALGNPLIFDDHESDSFWFSRVELEWQPRLSDNLYFDLEVTQDVVRYASGERFIITPGFPQPIGSLDYENTVIRFGLIHLVPEWNDTAFCMSYDYDRITRGSLSNSVRSSQRLHIGAQQSVFATGNHNIRVALEASFETTASNDKHDEYRLRLQDEWRPVDAVELISYYQMENTRFKDYDTWSHHFGIEAKYHFNKYFNFYLSASYQNHNTVSSLLNVDYDGYTIGTGLQATFHF